MIELNRKQMLRLINILDNPNKKYNSVIFKPNGTIEIDWESKYKVEQKITK